MNSFPCPICDAPTRVYDSRPQGSMIRRRRECSNGHRFNTTESYLSPVQSSPLRVVEPVKRDTYDYDVAQLADDLHREARGVE